MSYFLESREINDKGIQTDGQAIMEEGMELKELETSQYIGKTEVEAKLEGGLSNPSLCVFS